MIYGKIDENNVVVDCIVADAEFVQSLDGTWIGKNENANNCPSIGWIYSEIHGEFFPPKPYDNWIFDVKDWAYVPPVPYPKDGYTYSWHQPTMEWWVYDPQKFAKPDSIG